MIAFKLNNNNSFFRSFQIVILSINLLGEIRKNYEKMNNRFLDKQPHQKTIRNNTFGNNRIDRQASNQNNWIKNENSHSTDNLKGDNHAQS